MVITNQHEVKKGFKFGARLEPQTHFSIQCIGIWQNFGALTEAQRLLKII